jgi:predicted HNH restriction endonuclease
MFKKALKEAQEKCIVLCANCHRKLHWEEDQQKNAPSEDGA